MEKKWHAIYVSSRQEKKVDEALRQKGIVSYLPIVKTLRVWSDRKKMVEFPLLSGYVFVQMKPIEKDLVLQTRGVVNFVRSNGKIGVIRESEIESLKQLIALGYHMEAFPATKKITKGDKIKITSGALKNLEGWVAEERDESFFDIILEGIGYNVRVKLPEGIIKRTA
ncbi:MAG: UpxY family transcription antiterminator [Bacteroidia bacterium]|nr:UpxY family transcription antiterminator [Bacteroidia bacterium]